MTIFEHPQTLRSTKDQLSPHPIVWMILYIPFGALGGFISVALTFLATEKGLSITEGSLIIGSSLLISWLKWIWAPLVDVTLTPKKWYLISTLFSAVGVWAMSVVPLGKEHLGFLLIIIALANLINSVVGMSVEAMISAVTPESEIGRVSAWFQAGNLGGAGLGGALGLYLIQILPEPWMSGAIMGFLFCMCSLALIPIPQVRAHILNKNIITSVKEVSSGFLKMLKEPVGSLTAIMCILPIASGAAQGALTQSAVAQYWEAGADHVALVQGLFAGFITAMGSFAGGWICGKINSIMAYTFFGIALAVIAIGMGITPHTVQMYIVWNMIYSFGVGLSYAAFTAMALTAIGKGAAATGYNVFASLSNFPIWWMGLLLGWVAEFHGPRNMLFTEAALGIIGVFIFVIIQKRVVIRSQK